MQTTDTNPPSGAVFKRINTPADLKHWVVRQDRDTGQEVIVGTFYYIGDAEAYAAAQGARFSDVPYHSYVVKTEAEKRLILKYRAPGRRPGTTRWATRPVADTQEAIEWMNGEGREISDLPAFVQTKGWRPQTLSILGPLRAPERG